MANGTWKIARRGNAQLPLVIVMALAVVLVLLGKAQGTLFDRARVTMTDWMQPALSVVHAPLVLFDRWIGSVDELFSVYQENLRLKEENARLRQWRNVAVVMQDRVKRYQSLLHAVPDLDVDSVLARVIGRASRPFLETMILDAGAGHNIKPGQAVVDARGMIGRIYMAGERTSWVILLTDLNSRIPVSVSPGNRQAILVGDNTAMPTLDTMSRLVILHPGDQVVSSGDGGLLPPGLPIGTVVEESGKYRVALLADAASSEDVEVLAFRKPPEALPGTVELPAVAAGLPPVTAVPPVINIAPEPAAKPQTAPPASAAEAEDEDR
ncbi:MAG: rod shape-determining protein MreC [Alphaproteobacteria bacterium]|jgi:rod shape-determining protein MreC|nr:rod shape-determining protein MreC [Alphaproteobacteria bacterium]